MKQLAAIIIEDRPVDDFGKACHNHLKHLPKDTDLFIYTSEEAKKKFKEQLIKFNISYKFIYIFIQYICLYRTWNIYFLG